MSALLLNGKLDELVSDLKAALPDLLCCERARGRFTAEDVNKLSFAVPAVFLAITGFGQIARQPHGGFTQVVNFSAAVVTMDERGGWADERAVNVCEFIMRFVLGRKRGRGGSPVTVPQARSLYAPELHNQGFLLWEMTWTQEFEFMAPPELSGITPQEIYAGWSPKIGEKHVADYVKATDGSGSSGSAQGASAGA